MTKEIPVFRLLTFVSLLLLVAYPARPAAAQLASAAAVSNNVCNGGLAGAYSCSGVDLMSFVPLSTLGVEEGNANDIWGWTDEETGKEYALVGLSTGTAFVDVTDPLTPLFVGSLRTQSVPSLWRDVKVYGDYAVVVSEAASHGVQIFDLRQLRAITDKPGTFSATAVYTGIGSAHNVFVNEDTGFAYAVGSKGGTYACGPGLHMIDLNDPIRPAFAGCFAHGGTGLAGTGYTHDVQCVLYNGPDAAYRGREICFGSNESAISIADVTDKRAPFAISSASYPEAQYVHQGWLSPDHRYFFQDDELDELRGVVAGTTTRVWDVSDLEDPVLVETKTSGISSIDHNLYVVGSWVYKANYTSGLRIFDYSEVWNPREIAFFDTYVGGDAPVFSGAWSVYPFFRSGTVVVSGIGEGLFVLRPPVNKVAIDGEAVPEQTTISSVYPNPFSEETTVTLELANSEDVEIAVFDMLGRKVMSRQSGLLAAGATHFIRLRAKGLPAGRYVLRATGTSFEETQLLTVTN